MRTYVTREKCVISETQIMASKQCNKCGKRDLDWDKDFHKLTKKWKLEDHRRPDGKWCNKAPEKLIRSKEKIILCSLCTGTSFGLCRGEKEYDTHVKMYHPKGEQLTELDWHMKLTPKDEVISTNWSCDPHYSDYVK